MPECEFAANNRDLPYNQPWLNNAIPQLDEKFDSCSRYAPKNLTSIELASGQCAADMFNSSRTMPCSEYVYTSDEKNIQTEVGKYAILSNANLNNVFLLFPMIVFQSSIFTVQTLINWRWSGQLETSHGSLRYQ